MITLIVCYLIFQTWLVTGGVSKKKILLSSTELFNLEHDDQWRLLPKNLQPARYGLRGANIDNKIFMTGKRQQSVDFFYK